MRMWHQVNRLHRQASRAEILRNEVISHHTAALCNALFPHKTLQERELAGISMVARYGSGLLGNLYNAIDTGCHDHQVISLQ